jgi:hypothetical protein
MSTFLLIAIAMGIWMCVIGLFRVERHLDQLTTEGMKVTEEPREAVEHVILGGQVVIRDKDGIAHYPTCTYCGGMEHTSESPQGQLCLQRQLMEVDARRH